MLPTMLHFKKIIQGHYTEIFTDYNNYFYKNKIRIVVGRLKNVCLRLGLRSEIYVLM